MKQFFKENFVLVLGVSLPVLLIIVFMIAQSMTKLVDPPRYKAVFAIQNNYNSHTYYSFKVDKDGKLTVTYKEPKDHPNRANYAYTSRLYVFDPVKDHTREIELTPPDDLEEGQTQVIDVPDVSTLRLNPSREAPDGYIFEEYYSRNGNLFTEIFGYNHRRARYALSKNSRHVPIKDTRYYYGHHDFIGWIIE